MEVIRDASTFRIACEKLRSPSGRVGFVPTMGSLHEGHVSLMRAARETCDGVAISIFVNPLQFGSSEDLATYPRDLDGDVMIAEKAGVDLVFAPSGQEMYPSGVPQVTIDPGPVGEVLEGASRPGHFRGVLTVVQKLFAIVGNCEAFFGEKDFQQLWLIRRMASDLDLAAEVLGCPTIRETDGLAMSSRNALLSPEERRTATCLFRALSSAARLVDSGEKDAERVKRSMREIVEGEPLAQLDYATIVDEDTFDEGDRIGEAATWRVTSGDPEGEPASMHEEVIRLSGVRALIAARVGSVRLIDNMPLP